MRELELETGRKFKMITLATKPPVFGKFVRYRILRKQFHILSIAVKISSQPNNLSSSNSTENSRCDEHFRDFFCVVRVFLLNDRANVCAENLTERLNNFNIKIELVDSPSFMQLPTGK